ncbi:MAG: hypothetical protein HLUCCA08_02925 [Rhodobacteraceae bacterium HLUCCA08]|nr:MAG: hypothetical protein HLUCCA08_02925 [Rhodobacteraceae bacterium HLUCCA08]
MFPAALAPVVLRSVALVLALATLAPAASHAGRGDNNGNGNDNSNRNDNNGNRNDNNGNDRGPSAGQQRGLNAANANQNALQNAATDSTPARLAVYRDTYRDGAALIERQNVAARELIRLQNLSAVERAAQFPDGSYDAALRQAISDYERTTTAAQSAQADIQASLMALTGGRELGPQALAELHQMLGL